MILINNNWEHCDSIEDIIRIIDENMSYEFSKKIKCILEEIIYHYKFENENLESYIDECEYRLGIYEDKLYELSERINEYIREYGTEDDYIQGMMDVYDLFNY